MQRKCVKNHQSKTGGMERKVQWFLSTALYHSTTIEHKGGIGSMKTLKKIPSETKTMSTAILGGGDVAFPLLFSGVLLKTTGGFVAPVITTLTTTVALALLFYYGEKGKFYPAMPFITLGCLIGAGIVWLLFGL